MMCVSWSRFQCGSRQQPVTHGASISRKNLQTEAKQRGELRHTRVELNLRWHWKQTISTDTHCPSSLIGHMSSRHVIPPQVMSRCSAVICNSVSITLLIMPCNRRVASFSALIWSQSKGMWPSGGSYQLILIYHHQLIGSNWHEHFPFRSPVQSLLYCMHGFLVCCQSPVGCVHIKNAIRYK